MLGIFGSFARGEETENSDVDILYDIKPIFMKKYAGFQTFSKLNEIREDFKTLLGRDVDIATIDNDSKTFKEYALRDVVSV
ncbi:MAG TPA: DNA polymerase beta [Campylobacterales bacterium]|nr:DNA polymerase beta [Campylobacterales bacterium]